MKVFFRALFFICFLTIMSCGTTSKTDFAENAASMKDLGEKLKSEFGDAYYTSINITSTELGSIINVTNTKDPSSMKMADWSYVDGKWNQETDITLENSKEVNPEDYMFQLGNQVSFDALSKAVEDSKVRLKEEKKIDAIVAMISIQTPKDANFETMEYVLILEPKSGGTSFTFYYELNGDFVNYTY